MHYDFRHTADCVLDLFAGLATSYVIIGELARALRNGFIDDAVHSEQPCHDK